MRVSLAVVWIRRREEGRPGPVAELDLCLPRPRVGSGAIDEEVGGAAAAVSLGSVMPELSVVWEKGDEVLKVCTRRRSSSSEKN